MVPLLFDDDEAIAIVAALAVLGPRLGPDDPAQRALAKLQQNLPARLARRAAAAAAGLEVLPEPTSVVDPAVIGVLADAAAEAGRVRFTYERSDGETSTRTVDPYRQVYGAAATGTCWPGTSTGTTGASSGSTGSPQRSGGLACSTGAISRPGPSRTT